ncbi:hypothetical protein M3J09_001186 [Ascochyta lentis]
MPLTAPKLKSQALTYFVHESVWHHVFCIPPVTILASCTASSKRLSLSSFNSLLSSYLPTIAPTDASASSPGVISSALSSIRQSSKYALRRRPRCFECQLELGNACALPD